MLFSQNIISVVFVSKKAKIVSLFIQKKLHGFPQLKARNLSKLTHRGGLPIYSLA